MAAAFASSHLPVFTPPYGTQPLDPYMIEVAVQLAQDGVAQTEAYERWVRIRERVKGQPMPQWEPSNFARAYQAALGVAPGKVTVGPAPQGYVRPSFKPEDVWTITAPREPLGYTARDFIACEDLGRFKQTVTFFKREGECRSTTQRRLRSEPGASQEHHTERPLPAK